MLGLSLLVPAPSFVENPESQKVNIVGNCVKFFSGSLIVIRRMISSVVLLNGAEC
jgi:hypothetical protein